VRAIYKAMFFMLCLNVMTYFVNGLGILPQRQVLTPFNSTNIIGGWNATEPVTSWNWLEDQGLFGDVQSGLLFFWNFNIPFIESFFGLLQAVGTPTILITVLRIPWRFLWLSFVVEFISGRRLTGE